MGEVPSRGLPLSPTAAAEVGLSPACTLPGHDVERGHSSSLAGSFDPCPSPLKRASSSLLSMLNRPDKPNMGELGSVSLMVEEKSSPLPALSVVRTSAVSATLSRLLLRRAVAVVGAAESSKSTNPPQRFSHHALLESDARLRLAHSTGSLEGVKDSEDGKKQQVTLAVTISSAGGESTTRSWRGLASLHNTNTASISRGPNAPMAS